MRKNSNNSSQLFFQVLQGRDMFPQSLRETKSFAVTNELKMFNANVTLIGRMFTWARQQVGHWPGAAQANVAQRSAAVSAQKGWAIG